nr:hypothetical protein [Candidatus Dependentiae bacterium]
MVSLILYIMLACSSVAVPVWAIGTTLKETAEDKVLISPIIAVQVPHEIEKQLSMESSSFANALKSTVGPWGLDFKSSSPHITVVYLKDVPLKKIELVKKAIKEAIRSTAGKKIGFSGNHVTLYGHKKDFVALQLTPSVEALALEVVLRQRLDHYGIDYAKFSSFSPHISLGKISVSFNKIKTGYKG